MFNERLKNLRKSLKITQNMLSRNIGVSERTIRRYEYMEVEPTASILIKLSNYFNVSVDYLLGLSDDPTKR